MAKVFLTCWGDGGSLECAGLCLKFSWTLWWHMHYFVHLSIVQHVCVCYLCLSVVLTWREHANSAQKGPSTSHKYWNKVVYFLVITIFSLKSLRNKHFILYILFYWLLFYQSVISTCNTFLLHQWDIVYLSFH